MISRLELYEEFDPKLRGPLQRFLSRKGCSSFEHHTEEVLNKAWDKIFKALDTGKRPARLGGWMWTIAKHVGCEHLHQCIREVDFASQEKVSSDESGDKKIGFDPAELVSQSEVNIKRLLIAEVLLIAKKVSPELPELLSLRFHEGLDWDAIAKARGKNCATLRKRYSDMWREFLKRVLSDEELKRRLF